MVETMGPIPVSLYMQTCLTHPVDGYYAKQDVFGKEGDFITAPEVGQVFGECVALSAAASFSPLLSPSSPALHYVELGPGRGTLAADAVRVLSSLLPSPIPIHVHLVEASPFLSNVQASALGVPSVSSRRQSPDGRKGKKIPRRQLRKGRGKGNGEGKEGRGPRAAGPSGWEGVGEVAWYDRVEDLEGVFDGGSGVFVVANEFFDALPVHQLVVEGGAWREKMVGVEDDQLVLLTAEKETPAVGLVDPSVDVKEGDGIEISPASWGAARALSEILGRAKVEHGYMGVIIDYGWDEPVPASLRAIKDHAFLPSILDFPGDADLTADVDFATLARALTSPRHALSPPVVSDLLDQSRFLQSMGIVERAKRLVAAAEPGERDRVWQELESALVRLLSPDEMGTIYKCLVFASDEAGLERAGVSPNQQPE